MTEDEVGSQSSHQPSLEAFPTEIILKILCELADLDALYNLIRASPASSNIFDYYAHAIIEAVLSMCPLKIEIQHLIRAVILTRSSALPFNNLHDFEMLFEEQHISTNRGCRSPPITLPSDSLKAASLESIRSGLATACRISALTYTCLEFYLEHLRDNNICNPYYCDAKRVNLDGFLQNPTHVWARSVGKAVEEKCDGPPSWVEEMRVARALWKMQLVGEVQRLATRDPNGLGWPPEDIEEIAGMTPQEFVTSPGYYLEGMEEEAETVCAYLQQLGGEDGEPSQRPPADYYRLPRPPAIEVRTWITQMPKPEMRKTEFGNVYDLGNRLVPADPPIESLELLAKEFCPQSFEARQSLCTGQSPRDADMTGFGIEHYRDLRAWIPEPPLPNIPFDVFRRLGLALWDDERMKSMHLLEEKYHSYLTERNIFVWFSLLPEEEIARIATHIKNRAADSDSSSEA